LEFHEVGAGYLLSLLDEGRVDLVVVSLELVARVKYIVSEELFTEDLVIAVAGDHPLVQVQSVLASELAEEGFILFRTGYKLRERTLQMCRAAGFEPHVTLDGAEMDTVLRFAAARLGIALVPRLALEDAEGLVGVVVRDMQLSRTLGLVWHRERQLSPAAATAQRFLLQRLRGPRDQSTLFVTDDAP
jgi:LysR family transcriptional activator of glutamate synthase operon